MKKFWKTMMILIIAGVTCFALALGVLLWMEKHPPERLPETDAIIVLGSQVKKDGTPNLQLELRLNAALDEYRRAPRVIVVCGAQGADEPCTEASAMRTWLLEQGVPESDIITEPESFDTKQNLRNAKALLPEGTAVTVVTSDYHLPRSMSIARDAGFVCDGIGSPCRANYWVKNHFREVLGWGKYFLMKIIGN